jgi:predicted RNA-binding protein
MPILEDLELKGCVINGKYCIVKVYFGGDLVWQLKLLGDLPVIGCSVCTNNDLEKWNVSGNKINIRDLFDDSKRKKLFNNETTMVPFSKVFNVER